MTPEPFQIDTSRLVALGIAAALEVCFPIALAFTLVKKMGAWWRCWFLGLALGVVVTLLLASIAQAAIAVWLMKANTDAVSQKPMLVLSLALVGAAIIEMARYAAWRWGIAAAARNWANGLMFGLGAATAVSLWVAVAKTLPDLVLSMAANAHQLGDLTKDSAQQMVWELNVIASRPAWTLVVPAYLQLWQIPVEMALALMVLEVFRRGQWRWLGLAVLVHTLYDFWQRWIVYHPQTFDRLLGKQSGIGVIVVGTTVLGLLSMALIASLRPDEKVTII